MKTLFKLAIATTLTGAVALAAISPSEARDGHNAAAIGIGIGAGVLGAQKAVVLGAFSNYKKSPLDRGYSFKSAVQYLRSVTQVPILTGLPFGHVPTKVSLPVGARVKLLVDERNVLIGW